MKDQIMIILFAFILVSSQYVSAHGEETFASAEEIIKQKIACEDLTEDQLEILGDYFMEQMHPGEAHEKMDEMMGGEGSESLKSVHVRMGESFYCGEHDMMSGGMMNTIMGRGMMDDSDPRAVNNYRNMGYGSNIFFQILIVFILILSIIWLIKKIHNTNKKR